MSGLIRGYSWISSRYWSHIYHHGALTTPDIYVVTIYVVNIYMLLLYVVKNICCYYIYFVTIYMLLLYMLL